MNDNRTVEDRLRQEYFELLPDVRRVVDHLAAEVGYWVLSISHKPDHYRRVVVTSRIKECESALDSLLRRQEGKEFDQEQPSLYTLTSLDDLAGVRVLAFPRNCLAEIQFELRQRLPSWEMKEWSSRRQKWVPSPVGSDQPLAFKYTGRHPASTKVQGELQVASMLIGRFWEVEHSALYKPAPRLKGIEGSQNMKERAFNVYEALSAFEDEFEAVIQTESYEKER